RERALLAVSRLSPALSSEGQRPQAIAVIQKHPSQSTENILAATLIALALLQDRASFSKILREIQKPSVRSEIQKFLKEFPSALQDRFLNFLSLDPQGARFFWDAKNEGSYYIELLRTGREAAERVRALEALSILRERSALPFVEYAFDKDPNPRVRSEAL